MDDEKKLVRKSKRRNVIFVGKPGGLFEHADYAECLSELMYFDTQILAADTAIESIAQIDTRGIILKEIRGIDFKLRRYRGVMKTMAEAAEKRMKHLETEILEKP